MGNDSGINIFEKIGKAAMTGCLFNGTIGHFYAVQPLKKTGITIIIGKDKIRKAKEHVYYRGTWQSGQAVCPYQT